MYIETRWYDNGKGRAVLRSNDYKGETESTEKYDRYVEYIGEDKFIHRVWLWLDSNLIIENLQELNDLAQDLVDGLEIDITKYA